MIVAISRLRILSYNRCISLAGHNRKIPNSEGMYVLRVIHDFFRFEMWFKLNASVSDYGLVNLFSFIPFTFSVLSPGLHQYREWSHFLENNICTFRSRSTSKIQALVVVCSIQWIIVFRGTVDISIASLLPYKSKRFSSFSSCAFYLYLWCNPCSQTQDETRFMKNKVHAFLVFLSRISSSAARKCCIYLVASNFQGNVLYLVRLLLTSDKLDCSFLFANYKICCFSGYRYFSLWCNFVLMSIFVFQFFIFN